MARALGEAVLYQFFAYVKSAPGALDGIAGIAYMSATSDIVRVKYIKSQHPPGVRILRNGGVRLRGKEFSSRFVGQVFLLRERHTVLHDLIPYFHHIRNITVAVYSLTVMFMSLLRPESMRKLCRFFVCRYHGVGHSRAECTFFKRAHALYGRAAGTAHRIL